MPLAPAFLISRTKPNMHSLLTGYLQSLPVPALGEEDTANDRGMNRNNRLLHIRTNSYAQSFGLVTPFESHHSQKGKFSPFITPLNSAFCFSMKLLTPTILPSNLTRYKHTLDSNKIASLGVGGQYTIRSRLIYGRAADVFSVISPATSIAYYTVSSGVRRILEKRPLRRGLEARQVAPVVAMCIALERPMRQGR